jgi:hypothetical protein
VFTPNGDGRSDSIAVKHTLSESAFLDVEVTSNGDRVRRMSIWAVRGPGTTTWDGRRDNGSYQEDGAVRITITPRDRAIPLSVRLYRRAASR